MTSTTEQQPFLKNLKDFRPEPKAKYSQPEKIHRIYRKFTDGMTYEICVSYRRSKDWKDHNKKQRCSVSGQPQPEEVFGMERPDYGSSPELDKEWRRYNRAEVAIMKAFVEIGLAGADETFKDELAFGTDWSFSRYAGCSCGCSPGFISKGGGTCGTDVWVEVRCISKRKEV